MVHPEASSYLRLRSQSRSPLRWQSIAFVGLLLGAAWAITFLPLPSVLALVALGSAGLALLRWPWLIWPALAVALPISSGIRIGPVTATELLLLAALGLWLADGTRRRTLRVYADPVLVLVLSYAGVQLLSLLRATGLVDGIAEVVKWAEFALVMALLPAMVDARGAKWMAAALVASGMAQALLGLYQFLYQVGPEWFVLFDRYMRASGSFRQPNPFAAYLGVLLPVAVSLSIWAWGRTIVRPNISLARLMPAAYFTAGAAVIVTGLWTSWSRGGWAAAAAAIVVVLAVRSRRSFAITAAAAAAMAVAIGTISPSALPDGVVGRVQSAALILRPAELLDQPVTDENFALVERMAHWVAGYRMWESAPWMGIGAGNYAAVYESVRIPAWTDALGHAHNLFLNILAETGIIGLALFIAMWIGLAAWAWRRASRDNASGRSGWCRAMAAAALGAMAYLTIHSLVDMLFVQGIYLALALILATLAAGCRVEEQDEVIEIGQL